MIALRRRRNDGSGQTGCRGGVCAGQAIEQIGPQDVPFQLVQAGIPVAALYPVRERLQDRYARTAQARDTESQEQA